MPVLWIGFGSPHEEGLSWSEASLESGQASSFSTFTPASEVGLRLTGGGAEFHTLVLAPSLGPWITMPHLMLQQFGISRVHSWTQNNEQGIWPAKREKELQEDSQVPPPRCSNIWAEYKMDSAVRTKGLARWGQALPGNPGRGTKSQRFQKPGAESVPSSGNTP